jgi:hypothetical protein
LSNQIKKVRKRKRFGTIPSRSYNETPLMADTDVATASVPSHPHASDVHTNAPGAEEASHVLYKRENRPSTSKSLHQPHPPSIQSNNRSRPTTAALRSTRASQISISNQTSATAGTKTPTKALSRQTSAASLRYLKGEIQDEILTPTDGPEHAKVQKIAHPSSLVDAVKAEQMAAATSGSRPSSARHGQPDLPRKVGSIPNFGNLGGNLPSSRPGTVKGSSVSKRESKNSRAYAEFENDDPDGGRDYGADHKIEGKKSVSSRPVTRGNPLDSGSRAVSRQSTLRKSEFEDFQQETHSTRPSTSGKEYRDHYESKPDHQGDSGLETEVVTELRESKYQPESRASSRPVSRAGSKRVSVISNGGDELTRQAIVHNSLERKVSLSKPAPLEFKQLPDAMFIEKKVPTVLPCK